MGGQTAVRNGRGLLVRNAARVAYLVALAVTTVTLGLPTDRIYQAAWIVVGIVAFAIDRPLTDHVRVVADWLPLVGALVVYDLTRGIANQLGMPIRVDELVTVERSLFADTVPTVWLQQQLLGPGGAQPSWTLLTGIVYTSHFVVPWLVAALFYLYARPLWSGYMRRVLALSYLGLVAYVLMPAAPPWYAAKEGVIAEPVARVAGFGFGIVPVDTSTRWLEAQSNPVAAFPSLHAAFALLVVVALWPLARTWWTRLPLALFPLGMAFTLVYGGEHYVIDVFAGWACVGLACIVAQAWERRLGSPPSTGG